MVKSDKVVPYPWNTLDRPVVADVIRNGTQTLFSPPLTVLDNEDIEIYENEARIINKECLSTHGGSGWMAGSLPDGDDIICAGCNRRMKRYG